MCSIPAKYESRQLCDVCSMISELRMEFALQVTLSVVTVVFGRRRKKRRRRREDMTEVVGEGGEGEEDPGEEGEGGGEGGLGILDREGEEEEDGLNQSLNLWKMMRRTRKREEE